MKSLVGTALVVALSVLLAAAGTSAPPGVLQGVVLGPNGIPVPNAKLVLTGSSKDASESTANEAGQFSFSGLASGAYLLMATAGGFQDAVLQVRVGTGSLPLQRVKMKVAVVNEEITVTADARDPAAADGNLSSVQVDNDLLKSVPVKEGNPLAVASMFLDPAATGVEGAKIVVDGVETNELDVPSTSVKQVFVNKNPYSAEFGRPGKGRIEVVTRPGSMNRFHRRAILTFRDSAMDARNAFAAVKPPMQRQLLEGEMDGPLPRSKGTFYVGAQYLRDEQSAIVNALTATGSERKNVLVPERDFRIMSRVDFRLKPLHTLSTRYNLDRNSRQNQGVGSFDLVERAYNAHDHSNEFWISEIANPSATFSNEIRFAYRNKVSDAFAVNAAPAILVVGAFNAGGAQKADRLRETILQFQDLASVIRGRHTWRLGGAIKRRSFDNLSASNFGGTFEFAGLDAFQQSQPFLFTVNRGIPSIAFAQTEYSYFVQDEIKLRGNLGLLLGFRHELQSNLADHNNFAPRLGISWAPGNGRTVLRAGAGIFYERQSWTIQRQALLFDGAHLNKIVVPDPSFPTPVAGSQPPSSVDRIASGIRTPYLTQASAGVEHRVNDHTSLSLEYTFLRGAKLYRMRNVNAVPPNLAPPDPAFLNIDQFESTGKLRSNSVAFTFRTSVRSRFELLAQYTFSRSNDDTSGMFALPANNYDLRDEFGRSDFDRRHRLTVAGVLHLPLALKLGTTASVSSGIPFNITTGADDNHDTVANDRPAGVGRNTGNGPGYAALDLRLSRRFKLGRSEKAPYMELRMDAFNVLNHVNAVNFVGALNSPFFGQANAANAGRQMQASIKFSF
jgi:hypothetical protein